MIYIVFIAFLLASWLIVQQLFGLSSYHKYFKWAGPLVALYGILAGYVFYLLNLHGGFLWYIALSIALFSYNLKSNKSKMEQLPNKDSKEIKESASKSYRYFTISAVIYLILFSVSYLYFYNG